MTPTRFSEIRTALGWPAGGIAVWCGYSRNLGAKWEQGTSAIPPQVEAWLERWRKRWAQDPPPPRPLPPP